MDDPEEHFLFALSNIPGMGASPMIIPLQLGKVISAHLYKVGYRHHPELQEVKLLRPYRGDQTTLNPSAQWVPIDAEEPEPVVVPDITTLTVHEREAILAQYRAQGLLPESAPAPNVAYVQED